MMNVLTAELFTPVFQSVGRVDAQLRMKCHFARMCLGKLPAQSQIEYVRNSILLNKPINQELEDGGYQSFRSLAKSGKIIL